MLCSAMNIFLELILDMFKLFYVCFAWLQLIKHLHWFRKRIISESQECIEHYTRAIKELRLFYFALGLGFHVEEVVNDATAEKEIHYYS